jgi:biopolymer transport protein ExbD
MRLPTRHGRTETDIAMTPMIDVVFQLLIFFICTASFQATEAVLPMGLAVKGDPVAASAVDAAPELARVVVRAERIGGQTQWIVNERPSSSLSDVRRSLIDVAKLDRSRPITLDVAGDVPLGDMIDAYDLCRLVGLERIEFAVERQ